VGPWQDEAPHSVQDFVSVRLSPKTLYTTTENRLKIPYQPRDRRAPNQLLARLGLHQIGGGENISKTCELRSGLTETAGPGGSISDQGSSWSPEIP